MNPGNGVMPDSSTAKRRRLGTSRIVQTEYSFVLDEIGINAEGVNVPAGPCFARTEDRAESPELPSNQAEYQMASANESSDVVENLHDGDQICHEIEDENGDLHDSHHEMNGNVDQIPDKVENAHAENNIHDELNADMFESQLVQSVDDLLQVNALNQSMNIEDSFNVINASLNELRAERVERNHLTNGNGHQSPMNATNNHNFYGLPMITKELFKKFRNIDGLYDWQIRCLSLSAITERRNLIYALPTSGGKTLVAEVLMLREVLNRKRNAIFILPYVALVQEKIWGLTPFAVELGFMVEEYAGGRGIFPPKSRKKNSIYVATMEKGLALIRSLIEINRLDEVGLLVVDELHLIGEPGRGGTLESLISTIVFVSKNIQIIGMSATIGNLPELATFMRAEVFQDHFRPVELAEYVKLGNTLHKIVWGDTGVEIVPDRELSFDYSAAGSVVDPDMLGGLVSEVVPWASCLVFCPTKRNCESVARLLCKLQRRDMLTHRTSEREAMEKALCVEGTSRDQARAVRCGIAYHHAGLSTDERIIIENGFRSGVVSVLCCTSTLAAGVNLPAQRVVVRAPYIGRDFLALGAYRQMAGRAGRAGFTQTGESIIICSDRDWAPLKAVLNGGIAAARSRLEAGAVAELVLSGVALRLAATPPQLRALLDHTLMAVPHSDCPSVDTNQVCEEALRALFMAGALEVTTVHGNPVRSPEDIYNDSNIFIVSNFGRAAMKGGVNITMAKHLQMDFAQASRSLVLLGSLHLLYLCTPYDAAGIIHDYRVYYSLYTNLNDEGIQTAKVLGITEVNAVKMMIGKPITNIPESVLTRFYIALMLYDLLNSVSFAVVADKYGISRGVLQYLVVTCTSIASSAHRFCEQLDALWPFRALLADLALRLHVCARPELKDLMELPAVRSGRAMQLYRGGFRTVAGVARASVAELVGGVPNLSRFTAQHLISSARMMLIEKVENLRAEAETVIDALRPVQV